MNHDDDACGRLISRAYAYLRLAGMTPAQCCAQVAALAAALAEGGAAAARREALWHEVSEKGAQASAAAGARLAPPPLQRGSIGYHGW